MNTKSFISNFLWLLFAAPNFTFAQVNAADPCLLDSTPPYVLSGCDCVIPVMSFPIGSSPYPVPFVPTSVGGEGWIKFVATSSVSIAGIVVTYNGTFSMDKPTAFIYQGTDCNTLTGGTLPAACHPGFELCPFTGENSSVDVITFNPTPGQIYYIRVIFPITTSQCSIHFQLGSTPGCPCMVCDTPPIPVCPGLIPLNAENINMTLKNWQNSNISIDWSVNFTSIKYFEVEKSYDLINWGYISKVPFEQSKNKYSFIEKKPLDKIHYYRIKAIKYNNSYTYSNIQKLNNVNDNSTAIKTFFIQQNDFYSNDFLKNKNYQIFDTNGNLLVSNKLPTNSIRYLPKGLYIIRLSEESGSTEHYFIVRLIIY